MSVVSDHKLIRTETGGTGARFAPIDFASYHPSNGKTRQVELDSIEYTLPTEKKFREAVLVDLKVWERANIPNLTLVGEIKITLSEQPRSRRK